MEWVETTAKTLEDAKSLALDRLGVAADEAEFEILEEPRAGLFGRIRGEARVRARVMPTAVRPKQERRSRGRNKRDGRGGGKRRPERSQQQPTESGEDQAATSTDEPRRDGDDEDRTGAGRARSGQRRPKQSKPKQQKEQQVNTEQAHESEVSPQEVGDAAVAFMSGLASAFGATAETAVEIDGSDIDVRVSGSDLGLMVGHGGRTLMAVQDLARVASQRRLGDHDTRLRVDVAGYREKRRAALERFAAAVADEVITAGEPKALEPMQSADRKVVHDALAGIDGVTSRSEGDDPMRRVVISPA